MGDTPPLLAGRLHINPYTSNMDINEMSHDELHNALVAEISGETETADSEGTSEETEEETVETPETEDSAEQEQEEEQAEEKKPKSNVPKVLAERNALRKSVQELTDRLKDLEARAGESRETDLEFIKVQSQVVAQEVIATEKFFAANQLAEDNREAIEELQKEYNLPLDKAFNLYLAEQKPEELAIMTRKEKKTAPTVSSTKLRVEKKPSELSSSELKNVLAELYKKGEVEF